MTTPATETSEYALLLTEVETVMKALPAAGDGGTTEVVKPKPEGETDAKTDAETDGEMFGKSFAVTLEDGQKVDAFDGTQMMKALHTKNLALEAKVITVEANSGVLLKALSSAMKALASQGELMKSMQADITRIGGQGAGRHTVLSVHEKVPATVPGAVADDKANVQEFLAKSMAAYDGKAISGHELNVIHARMDHGVSPPADVVARVLAHAGK